MLGGFLYTNYNIHSSTVTLVPDIFTIKIQVNSYFNPLLSHFIFHFQNLSRVKKEECVQEGITWVGVDIFDNTAVIVSKQYLIELFISEITRNKRKIIWE